MATSKAERVVKGWGTPQVVTMPFSPTQDGIVVALFSPQTSNNSWVFVNDNGAQYARAMSSGGTGYGMTFPAVNGHAYTVSSTGNVSSSKYTFIPFG